jgi:hypothetical protein
MHASPPHAGRRFSVAPMMDIADKLKICAILTILPVAGGCDNRKSDLASCRIEGARLYPDAKTSELKDWSNFVDKCMESKGYTLNRQ